MGFLSNLFKNKRKYEEKKETAPKNTYYLQLIELQEYMFDLLKIDRYIAKSDYRNDIKKYESIVDFFKVLIDGDMMQSFCKQNEILLFDVEMTLEKYYHFEDYVNQHNDNFINNTMSIEKDYLDNILKSVDPKILLDEDQRRVILTDEDYCLVVAGAGAGKTTTVAGKVKYLVEKREINPSQILVISYTNKAVSELKEIINNDLGIACPIATFHSTGNAIIHKNSPNEKLNIVDGSKLYFVIRDYFRGSVMQNENVVNKLILFFASYFDAPFEGDDLNAFFNQIAKSNFTTMRSDLEDFKREIIDTRTKKSVTIQNELLRSHQEVEIANFLYLNNIDYEYEPIYQYDIVYARKPYTPDFVIKQDGKVAYIEHFGITENGENDRYSSDELKAYKKAVKDKVLLHRQHGTTLIYTFSKYNDSKPLLVHLKEKLEIKGFQMRTRSNKEVMEMLVTGEENRYIKKLINLICRFISNFKVNGYTSEEFNRMYHSTQNVRSRLFLDICNDCYLEYQRNLKESNAVDFDDMINESARILREVKEMKQKLDFKYVIVDEYQDISRQRFDLTKALSEVTDARIIAVGDDWQSIYAFSGSDITLFTKFEEKMGYAKLLKIVKTYRNSQEVIDIAGNFIQKNTAQITKTLESPKNINEPIIIYTYDSTYKGKDGSRKSGVNYATAHAVEVALEQIMEYNRLEGKKQGSILLLGRFGFDSDHLEKSGIFENISRKSKIKSVKYPELDITFMTAHASKGLGYDDVIVVNGKNETYGFPSKIEDDPVLAFVIKGDQSIDYAEERRLFYVAMTRTKNRVYFIAPEQNPSEFLLELKRDYKNVILRGNWNGEEPKIMGRKSCPICGYPLQYKYKNAYGLRLYICTNEPEVCGFMTNEYKADKLSITKCSQCRDGYLIIKPGKSNDFFLGCTNYKKDGTGCNNVVTKKEFYESMSYEMEPIHRQEEKKNTGEMNITQNTLKQQVKIKDNKLTCEKKQLTIIKSEYREDAIEIEKSTIEPVLHNGQDLNEIVYVILNSLQHISKIRYYGVTMMLDVLQGMETERILKAELNTIPEFGTLKKISREELQAITEWMIVNHFMLKTKDKYTVLHSTYDGMHYREKITTVKLKKLKKYLEDEVTNYK